MQNYRGLSLTDLSYLVAVAEELSFRRAADRCFVTQPTLSIQVKKCEDYLGVTIFERNSHRVRVTRVGTEIIQHARQALMAADAIRRLTRAVAGESAIGPITN